MQKDLIIKHEAKSFSYRTGHFILLLVCILLMFILLSIFKQQLQDVTSLIGILTKVEHNISSSIKTTEVTLKNTSTRAGFDCELKLRIDNQNYVITDTFDWSLSEMKLLFEYIKYYKNELLTEKEKFNLSRMTEKIKKTHYNTT